MGVDRPLRRARESGRQAAAQVATSSPVLPTGHPGCLHPLPRKQSRDTHTPDSRPRL